MKITYCKAWSRSRKRPIQMWNKQQAGETHHKKKLYIVLIGDEVHPQCFLDVNLELNFVGVSFLDNKLRDYLDYSFVEVELGKLFLDRVIAREYSPETGEIAKAKTALFKPDGSTTIRQSDLIKDEQLTWNSHSDISRNWDQIPEFGKYESLTRLDRWEEIRDPR